MSVSPATLAIKSTPHSDVFVLSHKPGYFHNSKTVHLLSTNTSRLGKWVCSFPFKKTGWIIIKGTYNS